MSKVIFLDAGHNNAAGDPGAVSGSLVEYDLNRAVVIYCAEYLNKTYQCSTITDFQSKIGTNCNLAISNGASSFVSVHHNAGGGDGCEIYYASGDTKAKALAESVLAEFKAIGQNSRGVKTGTFAMLTNLKNKIPCILTEFAFVDNGTDRQIIDSEPELYAEGVAIAKGVANYLALPLKVAPVVTPPALKSVEEVAREVIRGLWGNGNDRINRLKAAGYEPFVVQAAVNKMIMANKPTTTPPIIPEAMPEPVKPPEPIPQTPVIVPETPLIEPQIPEVKPIPVETALAKLIKAILSLFKK